MKFMENINRLQAALTELRREVQRSEAPKCTCPSPTVYPHGGDCPVHGKDTWPKTAMDCTCVSGVVGEDCPEHGKAGKCTCTHRTLPSPDCLLHGWEVYVKGSKAEYERLNQPTPDLSLHIRVAEAMGWEVYDDGRWLMMRKGVASDKIVPDFAGRFYHAMQAYREYVELIGKEIPIPVTGELTPQAICLAIVAHSERK